MALVIVVEESRFYGRIGEFPRSRALNWVSMVATGDLVCFQCFHLFFFAFGQVFVCKVHSSEQYAKWSEVGWHTKVGQRSVDGNAP